jgi:hypothetical protein
MNSPTTLLYTGVWNHIQPVTHFPNTKEFIFIDTQPRSEFDREGLFRTCFYKGRFYKNILRVCSQYGFQLLSTTVIDKNYHKTLRVERDEYHPKRHRHINPTLFYFVNPVTNQTIKYYISTNIRYNMCPMLKQDIGKTNGLILSGYFPHKSILDYIASTNNRFYCYHQTCYSHDPEDNAENILDLLYKTNREIEYIVLDKTRGTVLHKCDSIKKVDDFVCNLK